MPFFFVIAWLRSEYLSQFIRFQYGDIHALRRKLSPQRGRQRGFAGRGEAGDPYSKSGFRFKRHKSY